jgi:hypothetical protein
VRCVGASVLEYSGALGPGRWRFRRPVGMRRRALVGTLLTTALLGAGCGKKGPPLAPLVRLPEAPGMLQAERRGARVDLQFVLPEHNTDGSRPANVARVDVYAFTGPAAVSDADVVRRGVLVASVKVKSPKDPDQTIGPDEPASDLDPLVGPGLAQGATARMGEDLPASAVTAADEPAPRTYVAVGLTTKNRRGPLSNRAAIPLGAAPPPPSQPQLAYGESAFIVAWVAAPSVGAADESTTAAKMAYHVYDVSPPAPITNSSDHQTPARPPGPMRLTTTPITETSYIDRRMEFGVRRCYTVRAVRMVDNLSVEGDAAPESCETPVDTFPPAVPMGLTAVASEGTINLIWDPNTESDLAGYLVLRADGPSAALKAVTPKPITESTFSDNVPSGVRYTYAIQAVDTAGNVSNGSTPVEETSR